jgi:hypothetical protein
VSERLALSKMSRVPWNFGNDPNLVELAASDRGVLEQVEHGPTAAKALGLWKSARIFVPTVEARASGSLWVRRAGPGAG